MLLLLPVFALLLQLRGLLGALLAEDVNQVDLVQGVQDLAVEYNDSCDDPRWAAVVGPCAAVCLQLFGCLVTLVHKALSSPTCVCGRLKNCSHTSPCKWCWCCRDAFSFRGPLKLFSALLLHCAVLCCVVPCSVLFATATTVQLLSPVGDMVEPLNQHVSVGAGHMSCMVTVSGLPGVRLLCCWRGHRGGGVVFPVA
jgi:hypothetical protein